MRHATAIVCPICLNLPEWQRDVMGWQPEDFCFNHAFNRYPELPGYTPEQIAEARAQAKQCYGDDLMWQHFLPLIRQRCTQCCKEWMGTGSGEFEHLWDDCIPDRSYIPNNLPAWETDDYAHPRRSGMRRRH